MAGEVERSLYRSRSSGAGAAMESTMRSRHVAAGEVRVDVDVEKAAFAHDIDR